MKSYLYIISDDPYDNCHGDYHTRGNGEWFATAPTMEEALKIIFGSMPFPSEPVGRKFFLEGVSLAGVSDREVIQVWSDEAEVVARTAEITKHQLHGKGHNLGLRAEIKVVEIEKYIAPARTLLTDSKPTTSNDSTGVILSPMGASLLQFGETKHEVQQAIQREKMDLAKREWEMEKMTDGMEGKIKLLNQQVGVLNTYLHGTRQRTQMTTGKRGTGKYHVFQARQFLSEEIALLGNFEDFDFAKLEDLEKWLIKSGRIWKFLPFERCILATRIRKDNKDYGNALANVFNNMENMRNIIWIRDGENVCHVDVEFDFHNAVFPDRDQFDRALQVCRDHLWKKAFRWTKPKNFWGEALKPSEYDVMGELRRKPLEEEEPYYTHTTVKNRFRTLQSWLDSEFYTELLDKQIREAVQDYLRDVNKRQMIFAVLLQGIVDNTRLLEIPQGTDLFDWENIDKYFTLLFDYGHALQWDGVAKKVAPYLDGKVKVGEWIVTTVDEYIEPHPETRGFGVTGTSYKENRPMLLRVVALQEAEISMYVGDPGERKTVKKMKPVVNYHPIKSRRSRGEDYWAKIRTKAPVKLLLKIPISSACRCRRPWRNKFSMTVTGNMGINGPSR